MKKLCLSSLNASEFEAKTRESMKCHEREHTRLQAMIQKRYLQVWRLRICNRQQCQHKNSQEKQSYFNLYKCEECEHEVNNKQKLRVHKRKHHIMSSTTVKCKGCDFTTDSNDTLRKHMKVAIGH